MHIHNADWHNRSCHRDCARPTDADATVTLRRKALLEVAASASREAQATPSAPAAGAPADGPAPATQVPVVAATPDAGTYDLAAVRRQKGNLSILTQDGDTVQVRFRSREGVVAQTTTEQTADSITTQTSVYAFASGRVNVTVNGELDADELKAIGDLMDKVDSLANQFFQGDTQAAFSAAAQLGFDASEIAGFALRLSVKEYARASVSSPANPLANAAVPTESAPAPTDASAAASAAPASNANIASTPSAAASPAPALAEAAVATEPAQQANDPATVGAPASTAPETPSPDPAASVQQSLGTFLKQVLESLANAGGSGRAEFSMRWKLQLLVQAVQSIPVAPAIDPAGTQLATDSLDKLASSQP